MCKWVEDEDGDWETECGHIFIVCYGKPEENGFRFCPYCGEEILEVEYED